MRIKRKHEFQSFLETY